MYSSIVGFSLELLAAIAGVFYLVREPNIRKSEKYLVYLLLSTFILEVIGSYSPLDIFSKYFNEENGLFITFKTSILVFASVFMYSTFIIGFLVCAKKETKGVEEV